MSRPRREIKKALRAKGFREEQKGRDHDFFFLELEGLVKPVFTKLSRGRHHREIGTPLLKRMSKQLHLKTAEFDELVDCPMTGRRYLEILVARGVL